MPLLKHGVLAQLAPSATTNSTLYTCNARTTDGVKNAWVRVVNRSTATTFRIAVRPLGASIANEMYVAYDSPIPAANTAGSIPEADIPISGLMPSDVVTVYAGSANLSFTLFGEEWQK